jgi:hypothetical protein
LSALGRVIKGFSCWEGEDVEVAFVDAEEDVLDVEQETAKKSKGNARSDRKPIFLLSIYNAPPGLLTPENFFNLPRFR